MGETMSSSSSTLPASGDADDGPAGEILATGRARLVTTNDRPDRATSSSGAEQVALKRLAGTDLIFRVVTRRRSSTGKRSSTSSRAAPQDRLAVRPQ
jgi:hypothetical protein